MDPEVRHAHAMLYRYSDEENVLITRDHFRATLEEWARKQRAVPLAPDDVDAFLTTFAGYEFATLIAAAEYELFGANEQGGA